MSKTIIRHRKTNAVSKRIVLVDGIPAVVTVYAPSAEYDPAMTWGHRGGIDRGAGRTVSGGNTMDRVPVAFRPVATSLT